MSKKKVYREVPFLSAEPEEPENTEQEEAEAIGAQERQTLSDSRPKQEQEGLLPTQEDKASVEGVKAVTSEKPKRGRKAPKTEEELPPNVKDILSQLTDSQIQALYFANERERRTKRISVTMTPSLYDKIAVMAVRKGDSVNNMINIILEEGVQ